MATDASSKAKAHHAKWQALADALKALTTYKLKLAELLPIKGLAVVFDDKGRKSLTLDGVPLSQVNTGKLVGLATEVSMLRKSDETALPIVLLDGIENLDPAARAALLREVASRGLQVIAACVSDGPLKVLTGEAALA